MNGHRALQPDTTQDKGKPDEKQLLHMALTHPSALFVFFSPDQSLPSLQPLSDFLSVSVTPGLVIVVWFHSQMCGL